jgi:acetylornithine deacetylase/succinyl-diaminopimelate desuccinylase-like protein
LHQWKDDPFNGTTDHEYVYGRGAADDKGELITRIKAVEYYLRENGDVPCNIKFLTEGEEEIGSLHLNEFLKTFQQKIKGSDVVVWESAIIDEKDRPIIELGVKGVLSVELMVKGPAMDAHSSLAVTSKSCLGARKSSQHNIWSGATNFNKRLE